MTRSRATSPVREPGTRSPLDIAIEATWLTGLVLLPIAFDGREWAVFFSQPKQFFLHLVALLIVVLWVFDWAVSQRRSNGPGSGSFLPRPGSWISRGPERWALIAAAGFAVISVISTLLSPLSAVSMWGRDFNAGGYELYSLLSLMVIFFAVALRVHTRDQARRVMYVLAGTGALTAVYGVAQHFGWDPLSGGEGLGRVISSFGNPIFFASYLVMSTTVTVAIALDQPRSGLRWWLPIAVVLVGIQLAALWFTGSRGPWVGLLAGAAAFAVIGWIWLDRSTLLRGAGVMAVGAAIAVALALVPAEATSRGRGLEAVRSIIGEEFSAEGLGGRAEIWRGALTLARTWEREPKDSTAVRALRPLFGFGPEMYYYSYPLTIGPQERSEAASHAHNYPLQVLMELGFTGLLVFLAIAVFILLTGLRALRMEKAAGRRSDFLSILMAGILAALIGRIVEQQVGVARIGDLAPFWALMALVIALARMRFRPEANAVPAPRREQRRGRTPTPSIARVAPLGAALVLAAAAITVFFARDVQMLRASLLASQGFERIDAGDGQDALRLFRQARDLAPDVELYPLTADWLLFNSARLKDDGQQAQPFFEAAYETLARYEQRNPYAYSTQRRLAAATADLYRNGDPGRIPEMVARYRKLAALRPGYADLQALAASVFVAAGEFQLVIETADHAIELEPATHPLPRAWWARGEALMGIGREDAAATSFETAIARDPAGEYAIPSHRSLAAILDGRGQGALADEHRSRADEIEAAPAAGGP